MPKIKLQRLLCFFLTMAAFAATAPGNARADDAADQAQTDKWRYNLFNPTPENELRPLSLDANDGVIDPTTVDAGHLQVQGNLVNYYHETESYAYPFSIMFPPQSYKYTQQEFEWDPRVTLGLLNNVDLFVHPYYRMGSYKYYDLIYDGRPAYFLNNTGNFHTFGNVNVGTKINVWGNDDGRTAFGVAPYLSFPTDRGPILGGADIAFAVRLPWQFYLKVNTDPYLTANGNSTVYGGIENNLSIHKTFARSFDAYAYVNTTWESVPGESWYGYAGFGLGYQVDRNFEIFGAVGFGLDSSSYDYNLRCGLAWRF